MVPIEKKNKKKQRGTMLNMAKGKSIYP